MKERDRERQKERLAERESDRKRKKERERERDIERLPQTQELKSFNPALFKLFSAQPGVGQNVDQRGIQLCVD